MPIDEWVKEHPIYKALGTVGRTRKRFKPELLLPHESILHCPEVNRRVGPEATKRDRADAAYSAIEDAVNRIDARTERRIAEAVLCIDASFAGKSVGARKALLEHDYGTSEEMFKHQRPVAIQQVVMYLDAHVPQDGSMLPPTLSPQARELPEDVVAGFSALTSAVTNAHCAALACVFVSRTDAHLAKEGISIERNPEVSPVPHADYFSNCLFMAIGYMTNARRLYESTFITWRGAYITRDCVASVNFMLNTIDQLQPLHTVDRMDIGRLGEALQNKENISSDDAEYVMELFRDKWSPWFTVNAPTWEALPTSGIEAIAAKTVAILNSLRPEGLVDHALARLSFDHYYALLRAYYCWDAELFIDDEPMPMHIESYLRTTSADLAKSSLVWLNTDSIIRSKQVWTRVRVSAPRWEVT
jgi:hypothetical protein